MRTSLIITTYNRPDALHLVLQSAIHQSLLPHEIIVGDDGSTEDTLKVIRTLRDQSPMPVIHAWQEDLGFRAARVRNLAVSKSDGDYLIFIDGDMILHRQFIASHVSAAKEGYFLHGKRAMLTERYTKTLLSNGQFRISPFAPGITLRRYAFHSDLLAAKLSYDSAQWYDTQSANLSLWRKDFVNVNGFNEDFEGWGREDSELALRLTRSGLKKRELRCCAVTFHLAHGKDSKKKYQDATARNQLLLEQTMNSEIVACPNGFQNHTR